MEFDCQWAFDDDDARDPDGWGRHLWLYAEEHADLGQVAHLVRKFLKQFRPDQWWSLTYATTCSKPRVGEFGGGAIFVTADAIKCQDAYDFVERERQAFEARKQPTLITEGKR